MKPTAFINGVTLQEFFPLVAKLAQQIRMPVVILSLSTTGTGKCTEVGILNCATISIAASGSVTEHTAKVTPDLEMSGVDAADFRAIYDAIARTFSTSLVVGFNTAMYDVPVVYGNMVRFGLPIIAARNQLDLLDVWQKQVSKSGDLKTLAAHYKVDEGKLHSKSAAAVTAARILEAMLWRHGSESVLAHLQHSLTSYLTPDQVTGAADPLQGMGAARIDQGTSQSAGRKNLSPGSVKLDRRNPRHKPDRAIGKLKEEVKKVVSEFGIVRPSHLPAIAAALGWKESKTSIEIGRLLTKGQIDAKPFIIPEQQALLSLHLPDTVVGMDQIKLIPIREAIKARTGHDVEFIQIRLGLKALGIRIE
jgi:hypothetical protein